MRNRAKCKICETILESFHEFDYVQCKCGQIAISGGMIKFDVFAKEWEHLIRLDDSDKEIPVQVIAKTTLKEKTVESLPIEEKKPLSKQEKLELVDTMIKTIENLPQNALSLPISQYDHLSILYLVRSLFSD